MRCMTRISYPQSLACTLPIIGVYCIYTRSGESMNEIQKIIKQMERQARYALSNDEVDGAGKDWADGYNFAVSGMRTLINKLKQEYER